MAKTFRDWDVGSGLAATALGARSGAVVLAQRFGGALNLNLHFHALVLDGVYTSTGPLAPPLFHPAPQLTDAEVVRLTALLRRRIVRYLERRGRLPRHDQAERDEPEPDEPLFAQLSAASVEGRSALGPERDQAITRLGRRRGQRPLFIPGELCCDHAGFSLHAKVQIAADDRAGRERLCRYIARPAIASERLSISPDGRVVYRLRRHWKDGTSALVFDPLTFLERLAALVPRPRVHLLTYHGVLAPAAQLRDRIVPGPGAPASAQNPGATSGISSAALGVRTRRNRSTWAELLRRVFDHWINCMPRRGGDRTGADHAPIPFSVRAGHRLRRTPAPMG